MAMRFFDISVPLGEDTLVYLGDPAITIEEPKRIAQGDLYNLSILTFGSHTATHIDAPKHFFDEGQTIDKLDISYFVGQAKVFDMGARTVIDLAAVQSKSIEQGDRILFKTTNSEWMRSNLFSKKYVHIEPAAARYLASIGIRTVGIDYLTVEEYGVSSPETHYAFLRSGVVILEGLDLSDVEEGVYDLIALPIKIKGGNGSPVRAMLVQSD